MIAKTHFFRILAHLCALLIYFWEIAMIGDVLRDLRNIYGYKAKDLSSKLNISPSYLSEIENNKKEPSLTILRKYSDIYGLKPSVLLTLAESAEEAQQKGKSELFIRGMMLKLISAMSTIVGKDYEESEQKV